MQLDRTEGTEAEFLRGFQALGVKDNVKRDAWVLYKDGPNPQGVTRGQWMDKNNGIGPTNDQFARNSYAIHASLTGNEKLQTNGKFGQHDYMPPQVFVQNIKLPDSQQKIVDSIPDKTEKNKKEFGFKAAKFREIAAEIGVPSDLPKFQKKLEGKEQVYETIGGGAQPCTIQYDNQVRAGNNIPNIQVWKGEELVEVAWRAKDGKGKYDGKSLPDAKAAAATEHGEGVEIALKSATNRTMGTAQLDQYEKGAERRWATQIGEQRERNSHFSHLTAVVGDSNIDVKWLAIYAPDHALTEGLLKGQYGQHLRVIASGNGRTSVQFAMKKFPNETKRLLDEIEIPHSIAEGRPGDYERIQKVGQTLPAVSVPHAEHRDGPPNKNVDVMGSYTPDQIMIAGRDKNGDRSGGQRTLSEYAAQKLRLPDDAAKALKLEPNVYSKTAEKTAGRYEERSQGNRQASMADW